MKYRQYTFESPNPLVRFAHQTRLKTALDMVSLLLMAPQGGQLEVVGLWLRRRDVSKSSERCRSWKNRMLWL